MQSLEFPHDSPLHIDCGQLEMVIEDPSDTLRFIEESRANAILASERFKPEELALVTNSILRVEYNPDTQRHAIGGRIAFVADASVNAEDLLFNLGLSLIELHGYGAGEISGHDFGTDHASLVLRTPTGPTAIGLGVQEAPVSPLQDGEPVSLIIMHSAFDNTETHGLERVRDIVKLWGALHDSIGHAARGRHGAYSPDMKQVVIPRLHTPSDDVVATWQVLSDYEFQREGETWMPAIDFDHLDIQAVTTELGGFDENELRTALAALATTRSWQHDQTDELRVGSDELVHAIRTVREESEL